MIPPRTFISYSHDSAAHKMWVLDFATTLRNRGVDTILDQWDLKPGDDVPHFMENQLRDCDYVVMVCTEKYVQKANAGVGGVAYEKMIMTSALLKSISINKVIPIIRQGGSHDVPTFMGSKLYIDFSKDEDIEYSLDDLVRTLLDAPLFVKPEIGKNPFTPMSESRPDRTADGVKDIMIAIASAYNETTSRSLPFAKLVKASPMHRLTLDKYLEEAIRLGFVVRNSRLNSLYLTEEGVDYMFKHGLVPE